jgi:hypothetical protein
MPHLNADRIREDFNSFFKEIKKGIEVSRGRKEEKLKMECEKRIHQYLSQYGIDLSDVSDYESGYVGVVKIKGNTDAIYGNLIIEYKSVGYLKTKHIIDETIREKTIKYLDPIPLEQRKSCVLIIFDGLTFIRITRDFENEGWYLEQYPFDEQSLYYWITLLVGLKKKILSLSNIRNDFSIDRRITIQSVMALYNKLNENFDNERIKMLFGEWDTTFRYIYGGVLDEDRIKLDFNELATTIFNEKQEISVDIFLFSLYTYYSILMKLFACEITCHITKLYPSSTLENLAHSTDLRRDLSYIEDGGYFNELIHVNNFVETGFFSWYLDIWDSDIESTIKDLLNVVSEYDIKSFFIEYSKSRDLLKNIYQNIIPDRIRHDLGEFYTPTWLIDFTIDRSGFRGEFDAKLLDPGCGSGGFLINCIARKISANPGKSKNELLINILSTVIGFDVNPIAVLTARTNYLIAIAPLMDFDSVGHITLPVYLADSIITPTLEGKTEQDIDSYIISTTEGKFSLPKTIVESETFHPILSLMESSIYGCYTIDDFNKILTRQVRLSEIERLELLRFYEKVLHLHNIDKNKIWLKLILNSFSPIMYNNFDFVIGNPPWIKWDFLSEDYKKKLRVIYLDIYKLFAHKGMKARLGFSHDDISIVFTYVAMDKYLKLGGVCSFVLKQTLFRSIAGSQFRSFEIFKGEERIPIQCSEVHDFNAINPFGKGQETSVTSLIKGKATQYPVSYLKWEKRGQHKFLETDNWSDVCEYIECSNFSAYPSDASISSPWVIVPCDQSRPDLVEHNANPYRPRHGVVNDLNPVFVVNIIRIINQNLVKIVNSASSIRKKVQQITTDIESDVVYPLVKSKSIDKWGISKHGFIIIPHKKAGFVNESELKVQYPRAYKYLYRFKADLENRKSIHFKSGPFYSLFGLGVYTFSPFKVVWNCMTFLPDFAVASPVDLGFGLKTQIPDNPIGYFSLDDEKEAHYLCAILNSKPVKDYLSLQSGKSKWGISITLARSLPIPKYNLNDPAHRELSTLSFRAHEEKVNGDSNAITITEREIDNRVSNLHLFV